jgi:hypothetical protein
MRTRAARKMAEKRMKDLSRSFIPRYLLLIFRHERAVGLA